MTSWHLVRYTGTSRMRLHEDITRTRCTRYFSTNEIRTISNVVVECAGIDRSFYRWTWFRWTNHFLWISDHCTWLTWTNHFFVDILPLYLTHMDKSFFDRIFYRWTWFTRTHHVLIGIWDRWTRFTLSNQFSIGILTAGLASHELIFFNRNFYRWTWFAWTIHVLTGISIAGLDFHGQIIFWLNVLSLDLIYREKSWLEFLPPLDFSCFDQNFYRWTWFTWTIIFDWNFLPLDLIHIDKSFFN